jgi:hypothetical protein
MPRANRHFLSSQLWHLALAADGTCVLRELEGTYTNILGTEISDKRPENATRWAQNRPPA